MYGERVLIPENIHHCLPSDLSLCTHALARLRVGV